MVQLKSHPGGTCENGLRATAEDFEQLFATENTDLLCLALQLTADAETAQSCVILAMRDCLFRSTVPRDRMHTWARRRVILNAIRLVWGTANDILGEPGFEFHLQPRLISAEAPQESVAILSLPPLDRLAFVICVLERYSILDCALVLKKTPQEVYEAAVRAGNQLLPLQEQRWHQVHLMIPGDMFNAFWDQDNKVRGCMGVDSGLIDVGLVSGTNIERPVQ